MYIYFVYYIYKYTKLFCVYIYIYKITYKNKTNLGICAIRRGNTENA